MPISGGSDIPAETAAQIWMQQIEPLAKQGVKLGAPACTGPSAFRSEFSLTLTSVEFWRFS